MYSGSQKVDNVSDSEIDQVIFEKEVVEENCIAKARTESFSGLVYYLKICSNLCPTFRKEKSLICVRRVQAGIGLDLGIQYMSSELCR